MSTMPATPPRLTFRHAAFGLPIEAVVSSDQAVIVIPMTDVEVLRHIEILAAGVASNARLCTPEPLPVITEEEKQMLMRAP